MNRRAFITAAAIAPFAMSSRFAMAQSGGVLHAFGDSITVGVGAYNHYGYAAQVAAGLRCELDNRAVSSTLVADAALPVHGLEVTEDTRSLWMPGFNDYRYFGPAAPGFTTYQRGVEALAAWLAIPESRKVRATAAEKDGRWQSDALSAVSSARGDSLSFTVSGNVVYLSASAYGDTSGGVFGVLVDGVPAATGRCFGAALGPNHPPFAPFLIRIAGLRPGPHRVTVRVESSSGPVAINWCSGNDGRGPTLYLSGPVHCADYENPNAPGFGNGSTALANAYRAEARRIASMLRGDGLDVVYVDGDRYFMPAEGDTNPPDVHPNDRGHAHIARAFLELMG